MVVGTRSFFFFQAEDGIRDYKVTGVQTCALPISCSRRPCKKKSKARTPPRTGRLVARHLSGQLPAGLSVGPVQSGRLVSTKPREGSIRLADTHSRSEIGRASCRERV